MFKRFLATIGLLLLAATVNAGPQFIIRRPVAAPPSGGGGSNPIDTSRRTDWSIAGATIVNRVTQCGSTIAPYTGSPATINNALAAGCANKFVKLGCGTFTLDNGIIFRDNNVTLRGCGPQGVANGGTKLIINGSNDGYSTMEVKSSNDVDAVCCVQNAGTWTASSYAIGTNQITITRTLGGTAPKVGNVLMLDQANDSDTDTGSIWICSTGGGSPDICTDEGGGSNTRNVGGTQHGQQQVVTMTAVSGSGPYVVTFTPGLIMPNWSASKAPGAWWTNQDSVSGIGLEDFELDGSGLTTTSHGNIIFENATNCWIARIKSYNGARWHIRFQQSNFITVRDSYLEEDQNHGSQAYGFEWYDASTILVENNILHHVTLPIAFNETGTSSVVAYNYVLDNTYTSSVSFMIGGFGLHEVGVEMILFEGNDGAGGFISDQIHGTHHFITLFRNRWLGRENTNQTQQTNPIHIYKYGRFYNIIGNVLGDNSYHSNYANNNALSIYTLDDDGCNPVACAASGLAAATLFRWGNYDTVGDVAKFDNTEVPTGLSTYSNAIPSDHTLPSSMYLSSKPSFFGAKSWPGIGPDITGGDITGVGGAAYKNPARLCYENGTKDGTGQLTNFNPTSCY